MTSTTIRVKLVAFVVITVLGISYVLVHYIGVGRTVFGRGYTAYVDLTDSGGIFTSASVTYRGIEVGRVGKIVLRPDGIRVALELDDKDRIPADVSAVVGNGSALGEQYIDLQPQRAGAPYLREGTVIPASRTSIPVSAGTLLVDLDKLVNSVPKAELSTLVDQLGTAFDGTGPALQRLLDATHSLATAGQANLPQAVALVQDGQRVLDTQNDLSGPILDFSRHLASLTGQLRASDGDLRAVLDNGSRAGTELTALTQSLDATLPITLGNLVSIGQVTAVRVPAIRQVLIIYPYIVATSFGLFPGDGSTRFGVPIPPSADSQPCTTGYVPVAKRRLPTDLAYPPIRYDAFCKEPTTSSVGPRGSRQAPEPSGGRLGDDPDYRSNAGLPGAHASALRTVPAGPTTTYALTAPAGRNGLGGEHSWTGLILGPLS